jgi:hypothetical protein
MENLLVARTTNLAQLSRVIYENFVCVQPTTRLGSPKLLTGFAKFVSLEVHMRLILVRQTRRLLWRKPPIATAQESRCRWSGLSSI